MTNYLSNATQIGACGYYKMGRLIIVTLRFKSGSTVPSVSNMPLCDHFLTVFGFNTNDEYASYMYFVTPGTLQMVQKLFTANKNYSFIGVYIAATS